MNSMQRRSVSNAVRALGALVFIVLIYLVFFVSVGSTLFRWGKQVIAPASYWTDEASKLESQLQALVKELDQCRSKVRQDELGAPEIYASFIKLGATPEQAQKSVSEWQSGVQRSCNLQIDKMILVVKLQAEAKEEVRKHAQ